MALITCRFYSDVLGMTTTMTVILPQKTHNQIGMKSDAKESERHPVLYLLHGLSDDDSIWTRRTSIERYVSEMGIAVVMPQVQRSFYTDMHYGMKYWTFISEELPAIARSLFPLSAKREENFVAGLSMGGYGAFKLALRKPEQFAAAASLSGVLDINVYKDRANSFGINDYQLIFGEKGPRNTNDDLIHLLKQADANQLPVLYQCCGTADPLFDGNQTFSTLLQEKNAAHYYEENEGESHSWDYWDKKIQDVLKWLPLKY
ncbi:alpha/beta hydrolase family protein [Jeotgalibacillus sp. R-1-5s-1]|uniref:alpha/beta hydrolase n=1 Tax=Jeotgalibacillus sp. R-1-5s-1 TaxID=2555897 RepID=UPI00106A0544|nr:alpha/beta hydrolase family protein [Jeotgalibacillus sp. R-1-5s-1]TFE01816.1 esterase family protein [Jeotgalibacillus sp. R-1-5s-1]